MLGERLRRTLRSATGVLLALLAVELLVRVVYLTTDTDYDPVLGPVIAAGGVTRRGREGFGTAHWTVHGLRRPSPPDPGVPSILALGDSYVEAKYLDDDEVFTDVLEKDLAARGQRLQIVNAGRSYASAADYVSLAGFYKDLLHPRWTIIQLRAPDLTHDAWRRGTRSMAHFEKDRDGGIRVVAAELTRPSRTWFALRPLRRLSLYTFGLQRLTEFEIASESEPRLFRGASAAPTPPSAEQQPERRYPVAEAMELLHRAYDGRVTLLYYPTFDPEAPLAVDSIVERAFDAACVERRIRCINFRVAHAGFAARHESPYGFENTRFNAGHMNARGHRAVADLLAREIAELSADDLL